MAELKKLIPGETLMGVIAKGVLQSNGKILDTPHEYLFFYGNVVVMPDTNKTFHAPREKYLEYLNAFLDSKEGQRYERPSAEQIEKDIIACLGKPSLEIIVYFQRLSIFNTKSLEESTSVFRTKIPRR